MNLLLFRTSWRYLLRHPWQIGLCVLGVALGVAVVVAIDLANASASRAFSLSTESVTGRATHQIIGGPRGLDESLYRRLRIEMGLRAAAPLVEGYVGSPGLEGQTLRVFGVDPFAEEPFRSYLGGPGSGVAAREQVDLSRLLVEPATGLLAEPTAQRYGLEPGDTIELRIGERTRRLRIIGLLRPSDDLSRSALDGLLVTDISTAQELLGMVGRLGRIDLILPEDDPSSIIDRLSSILPPGAELVRASARSNALDQMTRAFELNLSALSLLALVVGMFLIYNTITFSVVQRRTLLGTLRCVGVSRGQIFGLVMIEAVLISLIGALFGLGLGILLGRGLVGLVTRTINDLYFVLSVRELNIDPLVLLKGLLLGIGSTLLAATGPALEAMYTPPRTVLRRSSVEERVRRAVPFLALGGVVLLGIGGALLAIPPAAGASSGIYLAFGGLFAILIGAALLTPALTVLIVTLVRPLLGRALGLLGRMAARDLVATLSRSAVAVAALMVAVSVSIGVGIMVGSFRQTVVGWLDQSLVADIYIAAPSNTANRVDTTLDPALVDVLSQAPGVEQAVRFRSVQVNTPAGPASLVAVQSVGPRGQAALRFKDGGGADTWQAYASGAVLISEPLAYRSGLGLGDTIRLRTDRGPRDFQIAGVYYDYATDRGVVRMDYSTYRASWDDLAVSSLALFAEPGVAIDTLTDELRARAGAYPGAPLLVINSNSTLRAGTLAIFDRTFAITAVLQILATVVAFIGILSALMALQLERARELGILRANGLTPGQLWSTVITQTSLMGLIAGLLAIPLGIVLALVLVYVINRRSFGWTLDLVLDPTLFVQALLVALLAALLAGIYPALRMSRTSPAIALREE